VEGKVDRYTAQVLINAQAKEVLVLILLANLIRDRCKGPIVSFSKKVFIPLTNACRNRCAYCGFRRDFPEAKILRPKEVLTIAKDGKKQGCREALFTMGEKPEEAYWEARKALREIGYSSIVEYLRDACELVIRETGLLPHSNPGVLSRDEVRLLKEVNASLGLMLENSSVRLCGKGMPHELSPGKHPEARVRTIEAAGMERVAFTTGILIGIGETLEERVDSLLTIRSLHEKYGHIQEVIVQPFKAKPGTPMSNRPEPSIMDLAKTIAVARILLPIDVNVQTPPNLSLGYCKLLLKAGINDWGGISPVTKDFINPEYPWPSVSGLKRITEEAGLTLKERLPIYPDFIRKGYLPDSLRGIVAELVDKDGYVKE